MTRLIRIGGKDVYDCTKRVMLKLCTERFLRQFSKRGTRNDKHGFMITPLHQMVLDAVLANFPGKTEKDVEICVGKVLINVAKNDPEKRKPLKKSLSAPAEVDIDRVGLQITQNLFRLFQLLYELPKYITEIHGTYYW